MRFCTYKAPVIPGWWPWRSLPRNPFKKPCVGTHVMDGLLHIRICGSILSTMHPPSSSPAKVGQVRLWEGGYPAQCGTHSLHSWTPNGLAETLPAKPSFPLCSHRYQILSQVWRFPCHLLLPPLLSSMGVPAGESLAPLILSWYELCGRLELIHLQQPVDPANSHNPWLSN